MGILDALSRPRPLSPMRLPSGSFTLDPQGNVITSTLPCTFPAPMVQEIGQIVLMSFASARDIGMPLEELVIHFASIKLLAREQRGGAIVFLLPQSIDSQPARPAASQTQSTL